MVKFLTICKIFNTCFLSVRYSHEINKQIIRFLIRISLFSLYDTYIEVASHFLFSYVLLFFYNYKTYTLFFYYVKERL